MLQQLVWEYGIKTSYFKILCVRADFCATFKRYSLLRSFNLNNEVGPILLLFVNCGRKMINY